MTLAMESSRLATIVLRMGHAAFNKPRPFNKVENNADFHRIMSDFDNQLYVVERQAADRLLEHYRHILMSFHLRRHVIAVWAVHGACGLTINGAPMQSQYGSSHWARRYDPVVVALKEIEESLTYRFARYIDGKTLN